MLLRKKFQCYSLGTSSWSGKDFFDAETILRIMCWKFKEPCRSCFQENKVLTVNFVSILKIACYVYENKLRIVHHFEFHIYPTRQVSNIYIYIILVQTRTHPAQVVTFKNEFNYLVISLFLCSLLVLLFLYAVILFVTYFLDETDCITILWEIKILLVPY